MYLKSLVLKGFKSFADRSALSLEPGITSIVGPNGSGKSNISDAVLWVLGERNAKHLRGQAMEDVIFAGSSARKSVGIAEVDLVLDNSDGTIPVDYDEVAVTRRMYRSGESEYLINGTLARRMDVLDILHDSGLGTGTHSIISQGSLDSILQSKPEDRRALIEEAAGVLKHKQRKMKSERKLVAMDVHLARVKDVAAEVERQLGPLERKAKRAHAYQESAARLAELNLALAVDDLRSLQRSWKGADDREKALTAELEQHRASVAAAEARVEELQERIRRENVDAAEITRKHGRASSVVERFDGAMLLLRERGRAARGYVEDLRAAREDNGVKRARAEEERAQAVAQAKEVRRARERADTRVSSLSEEHRQLIERRKELDREVASLENRRHEQEREQDRKRREREEMREALSNGVAHAKLIESRGVELKAQLDRARAERSEKKKTADASVSALASLGDREAAARERVGEAYAAREEARGMLDVARDEVALLVSESRGIEEIERANRAQAAPALSWLLEREDRLPVDLKRVAQAIHAPKDEEALVERLLGSDISALLMHDGGNAKVVADTVVARGMEGEVVLVTCDDDTRSDRDASPVVSPAREASSACGGHVLVDGLSYEPGIEAAVDTLLGDVVVCADLAAAFAAHARWPRGVRFATPDGCVVGPKGRISVGARVHDDEGVLARARRLEELNREKAEAEAARSLAEKQLAAAEDALRTAQGESLRLSQELASLRGKTDSAQTEYRHAEERVLSIEGELEDIDQQRAEAERNVAVARPRVDELDRQLAALALSLEEGAERIAAARDEAVPARAAAGRTSEALSEARLKAATLAERETYASRIVEARLRDLDALAKSDVETREALARKTVAQQRVEPLLDVFGKLAENARRRAHALEDEVNAAQDASSGSHAVANEARAEARRAHDAFDEANARLSTARVDKSRLEVQVEAGVNAIVQECKTPLDHALELPELENRPEKEDAAFRLRRRISNMGTINPDAADEYENLKRRHDYLSAQLADLEGARRSLLKIVHVIDARMKDDFIRTYRAVDANFREVFSVLFPGGAAELSLSDPEDLENTGVEVVAQPRGKRITKMTLMSGGEKSLTALALLFAVYRIRATPFYILDEVEAALDDSNLRRLIAYLETLRGTTQLIMITHQRRTMEMADVLFGVSMQADGVTKVVSQKLDHALQYAEN